MKPAGLTACPGFWGSCNPHFLLLVSNVVLYSSVTTCFLNKTHLLASLCAPKVSVDIKDSHLHPIGFDAALHMTEEMPRPAEDAPRAILYAVGVGGVT